MTIFKNWVSDSNVLSKFDFNKDGILRGIRLVKKVEMYIVSPAYNANFERPLA